MLILLNIIGYIMIISGILHIKYSLKSNNFYDLLLALTIPVSALAIYTIPVFVNEVFF